MKKHNTTQRSLAQILKENSRTITDPAFERPHGCWDSKQEKAFLKSLFEGYMCSPITRANVLECLRFSEDECESNSKRYYQRVASDGASWISLDGKHRRETIAKFLRNEVTYSGNVILSDGTVMDYANTYFKDMTAETQASIMSLQIVVNEFVSVTRKELPIVFTGLNSGALPTDQHRRNAEDTPIAAKTRKFHDDFKSLFGNICTKRQISAMTPEEIISKMLIHLESSKEVAIDKTSLDKFYKKGHEVGAEGEYGLVYDLQAATSLREILTLMNDTRTMNPNNKIDKIKSILFFLIFEKIIDSTYEIDDYDIFYSKLIELDEILDRRARKEVIEKEEKGLSCQGSDYYDFWRRQKWSNLYRYKRQSALWDEIVKDISNYGLIDAISIPLEEESEEAA